MAKTSAVNLTASGAWQYGNAAGDAFAKEDVQNLGANADLHDHSATKGLAVKRGDTLVVTNGLTVSSGTVDFTGSTVKASLATVSITNSATTLNGGGSTWQDLTGTTTSITAGTYLGVICGCVTAGANADSPEVGLATSASNSAGSGLTSLLSAQVSVAVSATVSFTRAGIVVIPSTANYKLQMFTSTTTSTAGSSLSNCILVRIA